MNESLHPSQNCISVVQACESCRLTAYLDPASLPTIGWGHTAGVRWGDTITEAEAYAFLLTDLQDAAAALYEFVTAPLNQNQFDALCSFVYNVKLTAFRTSTLLKKLNAGDYVGAAQEFPRWIFGHLNGRVVEFPGLVTRRAKEQELFERPV